MTRARKIQIAIRAAIMVISAAVSAGCEQSFAPPRTSADIATNALGLMIQAQSNGFTTHVFVEPLDEHGVVGLGTTDKLSIAVDGRPELPLVLVGYRWMAQLSNNTKTFSVVLTRKAGRFVSTVELPLPFSLNAELGSDVSQSGEFVRVSWTPNDATSEMVIHGESRGLVYDSAPIHESEDPGGTWSISKNQFEEPRFGNRPYRGASADVVVATRKGGKILLDPALAKIPAVNTLEQIRAVIVGPPSGRNQAVIAGDVQP